MFNVEAEIEKLKRRKPPERTNPPPPYTFKYVSRQEWGARPPTKTVDLLMPIDHYLYKFTSTEPCNTREDCIKKVQELQKIHMDIKGYPDIGYNFLIGGDLTVYEGTGWFNKAQLIDEKYKKYDGKTLNIAYLGIPRGGIARNFYCFEILELRDAIVEYGIDQKYMDEYALLDRIDIWDDN